MNKEGGREEHSEPFMSLMLLIQREDTEQRDHVNTPALTFFFPPSLELWILILII